MVKATLPEAQFPGVLPWLCGKFGETAALPCWLSGVVTNQDLSGKDTILYESARERTGHLRRSQVLLRRTARWPTGCEPHGHGATIVVRERESRSHGEGWQATLG